MNHYKELKIEYDKFSNYDEFKDNIVVKKAIVLDFIQIGENVNKLSDYFITEYNCNITKIKESV
jgi:uncharacterized protein with HEPN domain